jgi:hypothetical protein
MLAHGIRGRDRQSSEALFHALKQPIEDYEDYEVYNSAVFVFGS